MILGRLGQVLTRLELHKLRDFLNTVEEQLERAAEERTTELEQQRAAITDPDERQEFDEFYQEECWRFSEEFARLSRNSFLVTTFAYLEDHLGRICTALRKQRSIPISWTDLSGDMLRRANIYIGRLCGIPAPADRMGWNEIHHCQQMRNLIVHRAGRIPDKDDKIRPYLAAKGLISGARIGGDDIFLTRKFCEEVLDTVGGFLDDLHRAIEG